MDGWILTYKKYLRTLPFYNPNISNVFDINQIFFFLPCHQYPFPFCQSFLTDLYNQQKQTVLLSHNSVGNDISNISCKIGHYP